LGSSVVQEISKKANLDHHFAAAICELMVRLVVLEGFFKSYVVTNTEIRYKHTAEHFKNIASEYFYQN
jgi:hypothetical protein